MPADPKYPTTSMCDGDFLSLFEPTTRDTDVFITTSAKCGQTWLQTLLYHLKTRGLKPGFEGKGLMGVSPWLELPGSFMGGDLVIPDRQERLGAVEAMEDPRVFKMHVVWDEVPRPAKSKAKVITITRDPRDLPYSMFCHLQSMKRPEGGGPSPDFNVYFESWMERGFFFEFMKSFWPHRDEEDVLILRYEELHANLREQCKHILRFLEWDRSDEEIDRVLPLVDFQRMGATEKTDIIKNQKVWKEDKNFFREGGVGKNRARLSPEQEARIVERTKAELGEECASFVLSQD
jgi:hypothetical protein